MLTGDGAAEGIGRVDFNGGIQSHVKKENPVTTFQLPKSGNNATGDDAAPEVVNTPRPINVTDDATPTVRAFPLHSATGSQHEAAPEKIDVQNTCESQVNHKHDKEDKINKSNNRLTLMDYMRKYIKLLFLIIIFLVCASVFVNIYQAFAGDCEDLKEQLSKLEDVNEQLKRTTSQLDEEVDQLEEDVNKLKENNVNLSQVADEFEANNEQMKQHIADLSDIGDKLHDVLLAKNQTFQEFEADMNSLLKNLTEQQQIANDLLTSAEADAENATQTYNTLKQARIKSQEVYVDFVTTDNNIIKNDRLFLAGDIFLLAERAIDGSLTYTLGEYQLFLSRITDIYFESCERPTMDSLLDEFPFDANMTYDDVQPMLKTIAQRSEATCPDLYLQSQLVQRSTP